MIFYVFLEKNEICDGLRCRLALCEPDIIFQPSIEREMVGNLFDLTGALITAILGQVVHSLCYLVLC